MLAGRRIQGGGNLGWRGGAGVPAAIGDYRSRHVAARPIEVAEVVVSARVIRSVGDGAFEVLAGSSQVAQLTTNAAQVAECMWVLRAEGKAAFVSCPGLRASWPM